MANNKPKTGLDPKVLEEAQRNSEKFMSRTDAIMDDILEKYKEISKLEESITNLRGQQKKDAEKQLAGKRKEVTQSEELLKITQNISDEYEAQSNTYKNILDAKLDEQSIDKKLVHLRREQADAIKAGNTEAAEALEGAIAQQFAIKGQLPYLQKVQDEFSQINDIAQDLAGSIKGAFDKLPGGKYLSKMLGLDKLGDAFKTSINKAGEAFITSGGSISAATSAFGGSMAMLLNPVTLVAAALAGIFIVMSDITKQAKEFSTQTGLSVAASQQLVKQSISLQASYGNNLSSQKDILSVQEQTISKLGTMGKLSGDVALQVSETGNAFGYGAKMAGEVQAQMMQISGMSETAAAEAQDFTAQLALAEGVAPGAVMADIAKSARVSAKYFAGDAKALGRAGVEAAKLGLSLEDMAKTSESLLDIENSLTNQYQLSAMLGRQVNLDKARQLAAEGKIAEATKETLKQLGGIQEFERASVFEKERMAAAAGMTVDQLSKSLAIQEKMTNATEEELAAMNGLNLSASEIKNMSAEDLKAKLANQQSTEQLSNSMEQIKNTLVSGIMPVMEGLVPIFNIIVGLVKLILLPFTLLRDMSVAIGETMGGWAQALGPFGIILKVIAGIGIVLAAYGAYLSLSFIPVVGAALGAVAAAGVMMAGFSALNSVGDLGIDANGGPVVMSPQENSIFQGTKNDDLAMYPGATDAAQNNGTTVATTSVNIDYDRLADAVTRSIEKLRIIIDESAVNAIAQKGAVRASFK